MINFYSKKKGSTYSGSIIRFILFRFVFLFILSVPVAAQNYIVNSNLDAVAVNFVTGETAVPGQITLRSAIQAATTQPGAHIITFSGAVVSPINLSLGQITVGNAANGNNITITGPGMNLLTVNQTTDNRIFSTGTGAVTFVLQDITLNFTGPGVTPYSGGGGAIIAGGAGASTTLTNVTISNFNYQIGNGGAISQSSSLNVHTLTITNCIFTNNRCGGAGGAVSFNSQGGTATISGCTFTNNRTGVVGANTGGDGGAIATTGGGAGGTYTIERNTFLNNQVENVTGHAAAIMNTNGTSTIRFNRFIGNICANVANPPLANIIGQAGGATTHVTIADNNWWGVNTGPGLNDAAALAAGGLMTLTKWLQLKTTASPNPICASTPSTLGNTSTVTASYLSNSASEAIAVGNLPVLIGLPVTWTSTLGSLSSQQLTIQASGTATATFTSNGTGGTATVNTQVDNIPVGETTPARASITVNTLSVAPTGATGATTVCSGNTTTLTVSGGTKGTGANTEWFTGSCGGTLVFTGDAFTTPALIANVTYFVRYNGPCNTTTCATVTVNVNDVTGGTVGSDQTICSGGDPAAFTESTPSSGSGTLTYQWQSSTTNCTAGFSDIVGATSATYDVPSGVAVTTYYRRVTISTLNTVPCTANSNCITVTVNSVTGGTVAADQTICSGGDPALFTETLASTGSGTLSYQWQISTTDCNTGFTDIPGATSTTYNAPSGVTVTTYYRRVTTSTLNGVPCTVNSNCITVIVNDVTGGTVGSDQSLLSPADPAPFTQITPSTGSGTLTYQWQNSTTSCAAGFADIGGANGTTYDAPSGLTVTTYYRRVTISTLNGVPCTAVSNCITVTVITCSITLTSAPGTNAQTVCNNSPITNITYATTGATGANFSGLPSGVNGVWSSNVVTISGSPTTSVGSPFNYSVTLTGGGCSDVANGTIIVNPIPDAVATPSSQTVCSGTPITTIVLSGSVGGTTYNWTRDNTVNVTGIATPGSGNISGTLTNTTNVPQMVTFTITPTAAGCPGTPIIATVLVNPAPVIDPVINQVLCNGSLTTAVNFTSPTTGGTIVYNWTNTTPSIGLAANGTSNIASFTAVNTGTTVVTATVTVTATYTNGTSCVGAIRTFTITVNPSPDVTQPTNQIICNGDATTMVNFTGSIPGTIYNWTNSNPSIGLAASGTGDIASFTAINAGNTPVVATVMATPKSPEPITISGSLDVGDALLQNGRPGALGSASVCGSANTYPGSFGSGQRYYDQYNFTNTTGSSQCVTVNYKNNSTGGITMYAYNGSFDPSNFATNYLAHGALNSQSPTNNLYSFDFDLPNGATVALMVFATNANQVSPDYQFSLSGLDLGCSGSSKSFTYTVNPTPNAVATPSSQTICSANPITQIVLTGNVSGTTYNWTRDNTINVTGIVTSGSGNISGTLTNTTNVPQTVTFTITPTANGCPGTPITATVLVNPTPNAVATPSSQTICNNIAITTIVLTGNVSGTTYSWTRNNTATVTGIAATGNGNISGTLNNTTNAPVTVTFTITPTANGCPGPTTTATVTVAPTPTVDPVANQTVCNGTMTAPVNFTGPVAGTIYNWTNNTPSIGLAASGTGNIAAFTGVNATTSPVTGTVTVTPQVSVVSASGVITLPPQSSTFTGLVRGYWFTAPTSFTMTSLLVPTDASSGNQNVAVVRFNGATPPPTFPTTTNAFTTLFLSQNNSSATSIPVNITVNAGDVIGVLGNRGDINSYGSGPASTTIAGMPVTLTRMGMQFALSSNAPQSIFQSAGSISRVLFDYEISTTCTGPQSTFTITVNPTPTISCPANIIVPSVVGACTAVVTYAPTVTGTPTPTLSYVLTGATTGSGSGTGSGTAFRVGVTTVTITATNICATVTCSFTVTVTDSQLPVINTQPANRTVCAGTSATFSVAAVTAPSAGGPLSYQWQLWNGSTWNDIAGATASSYTVTNPTLSQNTNSYRVRVIGLCTTITSTHASLYVNPLPSISLTTSIPPNLLPTQVLTITVTTAPSGGNYVWFKNGVVIAGASGSTLANLTVSDIGTYRVVYTDPNGCVATSSNVVITGQPSDNLYVYPVPNNGVFNVRFYNQSNELVTLRVIDAKGAEVYQKKVQTTIPYTTMNVDLTTNRIFASGVYIVEIRGADGRQVGARRIIVNNQ